MTSINELEDDLSQLNIDEGNNTATQRQRQARAHQTVEEHIQYNVNNAVQQREHRTRMTEEEHRQYNANDAAQHRDRQAGMTEEEHTALLAVSVCPILLLYFPAWLADQQSSWSGLVLNKTEECTNPVPLSCRTLL